MVNSTEMKMIRWIQGKTRKDRMRNENVRTDAMVKPITTYVTQIRLSWYGLVMRREGTTVAKQVTTMTVGGKRPRGRPILRWMDRVRSDLRRHQLDPKLAQNREAWRKAVMTIGPGRVILFPINAPGMGRFQLLNLGVLGYGLELRFWIVIAIIVSLALTITSITTLTNI